MLRKALFKMEFILRLFTDLVFARENKLPAPESIGVASMVLGRGHF